jgi:hypothetical protein
MPDKVKKKLNTGNAALFASIVKQVGGSPVDNDSAVNANKATQEKQLQVSNTEIKSKEKLIQANTLTQNVNDTQQGQEEQPALTNVNEKDKESRVGANTSQNVPLTIQTAGEQPKSSTVEEKDYTKKENELLKKFLSRRKSKGHTSPILVDDSIKEKIDTIATIFGTTTTSFACNIFEEHFKENKDIYMELMAKKKPFTL